MEKNNKKLTQNYVHHAGGRFDDFRHRKYATEADICIVGAGAAGGILAYELSKAGFRVVVIEAGPFWDPQRDFASDELAMESLGWQDTACRLGKILSASGTTTAAVGWEEVPSTLPEFSSVFIPVIFG